jgi:hypothetical protein
MRECSHHPPSLIPSVALASFSASCWEGKGPINSSAFTKDNEHQNQPPSFSITLKLGPLHRPFAAPYLSQDMRNIWQLRCRLRGDSGYAGGPRHAGDSGLARPPVDHQHRRLHGPGPEPVQGLLAGLDERFLGSNHIRPRPQVCRTKYG